MGGGVPRGGPPNQTAYFVALGSILFLLLLLCCYFCYFFITKVKELSQLETFSMTPTTGQQRGYTAYPVQPVIRESATAMAALCKQLPPAGVTGGGGGGGGKGDTVFPAATSPAAQQTDTGCGPPPTAPRPTIQDKIPPPPPPAAVAVELGTVS